MCMLMGFQNPYIRKWMRTGPGYVLAIKWFQNIVFISMVHYCANCMIAVTQCCQYCEEYTVFAVPYGFFREVSGQAEEHPEFVPGCHSL